MEYQKNINLLDTTSDNVHIFNTRKWIEVHDQSGKKIQHQQANKI